MREQVKLTREQMIALEKLMDEKVVTINERVEKAKAQAVKESMESYFKYNHSEEYASLRKKE
jgi:hypothetical protein